MKGGEMLRLDKPWRPWLAAVLCGGIYFGQSLPGFSQEPSPPGATRTGPESAGAGEDLDSEENVPRLILAQGRVAVPALRSTSPTAAENARDAVPSGNSSSKVKTAAAADLPLDQLSAPARARVDTLLKDVGYFRRLPAMSFPADPSVYQYFLDHPDVAVSIWRAMEISQMQLWHTGPGQWDGDAGDGTVGIIDVLFRSPTDNLVLCEGEYKSPFLKSPLKAKSLLRLRTEVKQGKDGATIISHQADLFVSFPSQTVETVAKILSPLTGPLVDRNYHEISLFVKMMSMAMARRPGWVEKITQDLDGVAANRRGQLLKLTAEVYSAEMRRIDTYPGAYADGPPPQPVNGIPMTPARLPGASLQASPPANLRR